MKEVKDYPELHEKAEAILKDTTTEFQFLESALNIKLIT